MNITERLQMIVNEYFGGNKASFAKNIGIAPTSISNYLSSARASKPSSEMLEKIINVVDVNPYWLLTGKGDMKNMGNKEVITENKNEDQSQFINNKQSSEMESIKFLNSRNEDLVRENERLKIKIESLQDELKSLRETNVGLKGKSVS